MTDYDNAVESDEYVDYFVTIQNVESTFIQEIIGLKFTINCDSPFGYSEEKLLHLQKVKRNILFRMIQMI